MMFAAIIVVAALWVAIAAALLIISGRRLKRANAILDTARSLSDLLSAAPARPLIVAGDGKIDADKALLREMGVLTQPRTLAALGEAAGIDEETQEELQTAVKRCGLSGEAISLRINVPSVNRTYALKGMPAPGTTTGGVLLWVADVSGEEEDRGRMTRRLHQTEHALDSLTHLIESAPFPMWYRGPDLSLGLVNAAFVAAVEGTDAADVIARGSELIDGNSPDGARAGAMKALEDARPYSRTQPATIGGERRMMRLVDVPLAGGAVAGFAIDIQDLEDARTELGRFVQSQRELADHITAGTAQFDADRRLDFYNQPFASMAQLDSEMLDEKPEFDRLLEAMREKGRTPEVRDFPEWKTEKRAWFTAASEYLEEDWMLANGDHIRVVGQPLPDGGLRVILEDRTEQVRLSSSRDTLLRARSATFDNLFEVISVFASDGRLYLWNRRFSDLWELEEEWLAEHPRVDELVPAIAKKLVNPSAASQVRELVRSTTSGRQSGTGRMSMTDGRQFEFAAVPLPDGNALFTMVDVTDSHRIEAALRERAEALEKADKVKTDFVANMSYELRTPLTSIGGFAEMLAEGYAGTLEPSAKEYVSAILESVARLSSLIDNVLDLTRSEGGGLQLERERVDIAGLVKAAVMALEPRAAEKEQAIEFAIEDSTGVVEGDSRRLRESIEHVVRNAIAYAETGGRIEIKASGNEQKAFITISDNGPGISAEEQAKVFDRFHKTDGQRGEAALGLGLPLTRQFIEAHGGSVELASVPGEGTAVTLVIPRSKP